MSTPRRVPPIGAHIQIKGGLAKGGLPYADATGARAVQVFVGNPRGWRLTAGDPAQDAAFTAGCAERGVPAFVHTPFLVNVGSPTEATVERSVASIAHNLRRGAELGCRGWTPDRPAARGCWSSRAPAAGGAWRPRSRISGRTWPRWSTTRGWASVSTPATRGRPGTTWPARVG